ncbi:MAG: hydroxymethylglutaryl-CoA lyase [Phycisphaerales bacterium]
MDRVRITDVSPRDGLQNEPLGPAGPIPAAQKARLVQLLAASGVDEVEVSSFVSPRWVPQLGDAADVFAALAHLSPRPVFSALVPNEKGMAAALEVNQRAGRRVLDKIALFTAASETFAHRNINAGIAESIRRFEPVVAAAGREGLLVRAYISCAVACPFEGRTDPQKVAHVAQALADLGADDLDLGDTIGAAEPGDITLLVQAIAARLGDAVIPRLTLHLHDTFGRAAESVGEGLQMGIRSFDGAVGGLGGCPYASSPGRRAPGNISTETLIHRLQRDGYECAVDPTRLAVAAAFAAQIVAPGRAQESRA